jgi:FkbM family methyltransferase
MTSKISESFWGTIFKISSLRRRLAFQVKYRCLTELDLRVSLGHDVCVPWWNEEIGASFAEIFLEQEYSGMFEFMKPPARWIDLGAFAGFFSIWLVWIRNRLKLSDSPCEALLIDADRERAGYIADLLRINNLSERFHFRYGAIDAGGGTSRFVHIPYMSSALASIAGSVGQPVDVPILTCREIVSLIEPPYDLVKVDIEGAEYELLQNYREFLRHCDHLLIEWHSWHSGGGGLGQLRELADDAGFHQIAELQPARAVPAGQTGIILFRRTEPNREQVAP